MVDKGFAGLYKDGDLWSGGFLKRVEMAKRGRRVEGKKVDMLGYLQRKVGIIVIGGGRRGRMCQFTKFIRVWIRSGGIWRRCYMVRG